MSNHWDVFSVGHCLEDQDGYNSTIFFENAYVPLTAQHCLHHWLGSSTKKAQTDKEKAYLLKNDTLTADDWIALAEVMNILKKFYDFTKRGEWTDLSSDRGILSDYMTTLSTPLLNALPEGIITATVDYNKPETLIKAIKGQDALVITLSGHASNGTELSLVRAAGKAGVSWIIPNEWSPDTANESLVEDVFIFESKGSDNMLCLCDINSDGVLAVITRKAIKDFGKNSFVAICTGFWYEWSLAIPGAFGIDLINHKATLYDEGETRISVSTWPQIGCAIATLLPLPIQHEGLSTAPCLENFRDRVVYINSCTVSQRDMLDSALRVTGTKGSDWTIEKESTHERYLSGIQDIQRGMRIGAAINIIEWSLDRRGRR